MLSFVAAVAFLVAIGAVGVAALRRARLCLNPLEQIAYGMPAGAVAASLAMVPLCIFFGLTRGLVLVVGVVCSGLAFLLLPESDYPSPTALREAIARLRRRPRRVSLPAVWCAARRSQILIPALVIGALALRWVVLWYGALRLDAAGLWTSQSNIWADWSVHLADVTSFAYGDNFPAENPRFAGPPYAYHHLTSVTAAAMVKLGMAPWVALPLQSFLFSVLIALGLYAFARRLLADRGAATLTLVLFFVGGGFGWLATAAEMDRSHTIWGVLLNHAWDNTRSDAGNFRWENQYHLVIEAQRAYLYGLPLAMLILTLLWSAVRTGHRRAFVAAGVVAGLLPLAHLSTLLALALITPFLFLLFPAPIWRPPVHGWVLFFAVWIAIAVPQLYLQQSGGRGATTGLRVDVGWIAAPDGWAWFWVKNLGLFLPFLALALLDRSRVTSPARRFLWAFMPLFVIANVVLFQPWNWDNIKLLLFWFLAVCLLVAHLLAKTWREQRALTARCLIAGAVATLVLSGTLLNLYQLRSDERYLLLSREELELAAAVRAQTPRDAVFVVGLQPNHPIPLMAGRRILTTFPGYLWVLALDYEPRERDVRAIYAFDPNTPDLLRADGVDYVVIGPWERDQLQANVDAFRARYPVVIQTANYEVFDVRNAAGADVSSPP